jgi:two-component system, NtrC family, response regulator HydG
MTELMSQNISLNAEKSAHLSVLVVDDERLIRWSLSQGLADRGHEVTTAATGTDAIHEIGAAHRAFDVVILDYRLPDRQDLTLLDDVRRLSPESVVMMMTAFGDDNMRTGARERGAYAVVDKPFFVTNFVALVESSVVR